MLFLSAMLVLSACSVQMGGRDGDDSAEDTSGVTSRDTSDEETAEIATVTAYSFWESWDSDADKDGAEISFYFEDSTGGYVYPSSEDWEVTVTLFNADYNDDFDYVKTDQIYTGTFKKDEVLYDSLGDPFVRIPAEEITGAKDTYGWAEMTISSPSYGEFSAVDEYAQIDQ